MNELQDRMQAAFNLVCPAEHVRQLIKCGALPVSADGCASWKDPICALVLDEDLTAKGITIDEVKESIVFFTATEATVTREKIGGTVTERFSEPKDGYLVRAEGYRRGPAGDA